MRTRAILGVWHQIHATTQSFHEKSTSDAHDLPKYSPDPCTAFILFAEWDDVDLEDQLKFQPRMVMRILIHTCHECGAGEGREEHNHPEGNMMYFGALVFHSHSNFKWISPVRLQSLQCASEIPARFQRGDHLMASLANFFLVTSSAFKFTGTKCHKRSGRTPSQVAGLPALHLHLLPRSA